MQRRWLIRLCFLLPLVLCVLAWAWSTQHRIEVSYVPSGSRNTVSCELVWGQILIQRLDAPWEVVEEGWSVESGPTRSLRIMDSYYGGHPRRSFLGFTYTWHSPSIFLARLPLWFPILIFSALLIPVWRKTRPARKTGSFPVEPRAPAQSPGDPAA